MNAVLLLALALGASPDPHCASAQAADVPIWSSAGAVTVRAALSGQAYVDGHLHLTQEETDPSADIPRDELQSYLSLHAEMLSATRGARLMPWADLRPMVERGAQSSARANRHADPTSALDESHVCS